MTTPEQTEDRARQERVNRAPLPTPEQLAELRELLGLSGRTSAERERAA